MADRLGQQFGNYRLITLLGQGSYAQVYLGQHVRLDLQAAIKVLHGHLSSSEAERFRQEAQTMERLTHPSIVRVFDFAVQDGTPFLIMEYASNGSLRQRYPEGSIVSLPTIIPSIKQVATALQYAHEQRYIHRDVKPENMLLGRQQEVLLSDFGLAALARSTSSLSTQGAVGTIAYIAPEQIEGHPRAASDQYALAVVIYEWLCGVRPFDGSATEMIVKQLGAPPPPLREHVPTISAEVEQVVLRALAKDPKERYASVAAFATELERASQHASSHPSPLPMERSFPELSAKQSYTTVAVGQAAGVTEATPPAEQVSVPAEFAVSSDSSQSPRERSTPHSLAAARTSPIDVPLLPQPAKPIYQRGVLRITAGLLIGLVVLVIAGTILGSMSLLTHFGVIGTHSTAITSPVRGGSHVHTGRVAWQGYLDIDQSTAAIFSANADGSDVRQLTHPNFGEQDSFPDWSPDGSKILFAHQDVNTTSDVWVMNADGTDPRQLTHCTGVCNGAQWGRWSPDGSKILYSVADNPIRPDGNASAEALWIMNADGSHPVQITHPPLPTSIADNAPAWSPDGKQIIFARNHLMGQSFDDQALFLINLDGSGLKQLTAWGHLEAGNARWSPDGTRILFQSYGSFPVGPIPQLYTIFPDGTHLMQVTSNELNFDPAWSPDGTKIIFAHRSLTGKDQNAHLYEMHADGSGLVQITRSPFWQRQPAWWKA